MEVGVQNLGGYDGHVCQRLYLRELEEADDDEQYPVIQFFCCPKQRSEKIK